MLGQEHPGVGAAAPDSAFCPCNVLPLCPVNVTCFHPARSTTVYDTVGTSSSQSVCSLHVCASLVPPSGGPVKVRPVTTGNTCCALIFRNAWTSLGGSLFVELSGSQVLRVP